jgi:hypothetical protein
MGFVRDGIENVRVLVLSDGVAEDGQCAGVSRAALVTWHSPHAGMLHQIYVNGVFAGAAVDTEQRKAIVQLPALRQSAARVVVIAVEPAEADVNFADELEPAVPDTGRLRITLVRSQTLPIGATVNIYCDNGTGQIDYSETMNTLPIPIWPCAQDKAGFGMAQFGAADFGYDALAAVGFAKGAFGLGQFGLDADVIEWTGPRLPAGQYRFAVRVADESGQEGPANETEPVVVLPAQTPAAGLNVTAFDPSASQFMLSVTG